MNKRQFMKGMIVFFVCSATYEARFRSGTKRTRRFGSESTTRTAFDDVQTTSQRAFTAADVFT